MGVGVGQIVLLVVLGLLLFGNFSSVMSNLGKGLSRFRKEYGEAQEEDDKLELGTKASNKEGYCVPGNPSKDRPSKKQSSLDNKD